MGCDFGLGVLLVSFSLSVKLSAFVDCFLGGRKGLTEGRGEGRRESNEGREGQKDMARAIN